MVRWSRLLVAALPCVFVCRGAAIRLIMKVSLTAGPDGASLVYTSVKEMKNLDILYKYLVHRLYGFPFHCPAQVVERDAVFM